ncbi:MAG TPA: HNH endonuclease [Hyphomicrobiaceae bacterium]|jgi:hypothetical protein
MYGLAPPINALLLAHVRRRCREDPNTGCWIWTGSLARTGYANVLTWPRHLGGDAKSRNAYVLAYIAIKGPVPPGMELDHLCGRRACANPWHMEAVPPAVNHLRARPTGQLPLIEWDRSEWPALAARRARMRRGSQATAHLLDGC